MGDRNNISQYEIESRERLARIESTIEHLAKSVTDHLERWDKQWAKIDDLSEKMGTVEKEVLLKFNTLDTERKMIKSFASPIWSLLSGLVGGSLITLLGDKFKEFFSK